jgi:hypothetical protein
MGTIFSKVMTKKASKRTRLSNKICLGRDAGFEPHSSYDGRSGGAFGTLAYPHLILPDSAYYGHLASHHGVIGAPLYPGGAIRTIYRYLSHLSIENDTFIGSYCAHYGKPLYKAAFRVVL